MADSRQPRLSDEQVDRLVGLLGAPPSDLPLDSAARLVEELLPLVRRERARDRRGIGRRWQLFTPARGGRPSALPRMGARRLAILAVAAALAVAGSWLAGAGGHLAPPPSATATPSGSSLVSPTAGATLASLAPFGYPGGGTIEYTSHDSSGGDVLWLVDPSGANRSVFLRGGCCGLFSPDGTQLAVAAPGVTPVGTTRDPSLLGIAVFDRASGRLAHVVPTGCGSCAILSLNYEPDAWSPDGRYIALDMWSDSDPGAAGMGLADRDFPPFAWDWAQGRVTGAHPDIPIAFSPDSTMLLFLRAERTDGPTSSGPLFVLQVSDLSVRQVSPPGVTVETNGLVQGPASWSPDGATIVFAGDDGTAHRTSIFSTSASVGEPVRTLVADAPGATSARFAPDGKLIAFDAEAAGSPFHDLFVVAPDGSRQTDLSSSFDPGVCCGEWSPDGRALVVAGTTSDDSHNNLFIIAADGSGIWQVTNDSNVYSGFLWGPSLR